MTPGTTSTGLPPNRFISKFEIDNSLKPARAASAIDAPYTIRFIPAQWIAAKHIGHGSVLE